MRSKAEVMAEIRTMLGDVLATSAAGTRYTRVARAHGYVDGYMRALLDLGAASRVELIELVAAERERVNGPAIGTLEGSPDEVAVA
jgi:hypothetical protein